MKSPKLSFLLVSLAGILAAVCVYQEILSENVSNEVLSDPDSNEKASIETADQSHRLLKPKTNIGIITSDKDASSEANLAYALLRSLVDQYKRHYGQDQLMHELRQCRERNGNTKRSVASGLECPELMKRKFLVSYYWCPEYAGNRLHHFMNGMIWAIVTGRTLLYDVYDEEACLAFQKVTHRGKSSSCAKYGTREDALKECSQALHLAKWIPSFHDWKEELGLEEPTNEYCGLGGGKAEFKDGIKADALPDRVISSCYSVLQNAGAWMYYWLTSPSKLSTSPLSKQSSIEIARTLIRLDGMNWNYDDHGYKAWHLYGLIFNEAFRIHLHLHPSKEEIVSGPDVASIAIHSRHIDSSNDGSDVSSEKSCLKKLLDQIKREKPFKRCAVFIMSDRLATIENLSRETESLGCHAIRLKKYTGNLNSQNVKRGIVEEHGPFHVVDFIRDLALASNAEDGLIGPNNPSSSTFLLREMMEHNRRKKGITGNIATCSISRKK